MPQMTFLIGIKTNAIFWATLFQSMAVADGVYESRWYDGHLCYQKCLLLIIQACQRHQKLTLYKFSVASHAAFSTVSICRQFHTRQFLGKIQTTFEYISIDRGQFVETAGCTENILWELIPANGWCGLAMWKWVKKKLNAFFNYVDHWHQLKPTFVVNHHEGCE